MNRMPPRNSENQGSIGIHRTRRAGLRGGNRSNRPSLGDVVDKRLFRDWRPMVWRVIVLDEESVPRQRFLLMRSVSLVVDDEIVFGGEPVEVGPCCVDESLMIAAGVSTNASTRNLGGRGHMAPAAGTLIKVTLALLKFAR